MRTPGNPPAEKLRHPMVDNLNRITKTQLKVPVVNPNVQAFC